MKSLYDLPTERQVLGIESSCDETGVSLVAKENEELIIVENNLASSLSLHAETGGIIPEIAAREQLQYILPLIEKTMKHHSWNDVSAVAVTYGPGLIGSLLVGVETAKALAYTLKKPIVPVNHLHGHIFANFICEKSEIKSQKSKTIAFPAIALVVSGAHTDLVLMRNKHSLRAIGSTRDDAAGEAFDKIGRLLGLPYPAGATIAKLAGKGNSKTYRFPRPLVGSDDFDFSFSGLKTAVLRKVKAMKELNDETVADLCASVQEAIVDVLVKKTIKAAAKYRVKSILLGGGVAANEKLREELMRYAISNKLDAELFAPQKALCTDNGAMIAAAGFFGEPKDWRDITADPELYY